ncbi:LysR family transcriptional regulator [Thioclava sp. SK-1]|uniref:LysR family transcriptional regulator n=1 Tax=Thioclava sp. SK-1 TaxID=1889770 RepID=UPI000826F482|nr:LysR family transcriptional regulator [Thioclava sp. SK-1]OCX56643.1 LysR family transcriptional regulator [Thioclava sp. SK-1]
MPKPEFAKLNAFITVAEIGSFRGAAKQLGLSPSALSHAIRTLEEDLNLRLFNRTTRSVALTEAGQALLQRISPALDDLGQALDDASSNARRPRGHIRISASEESVQILMQDVLPSFLAKHPDIHLEFATETRMVDIVKDGFDAGIRLHEDVPLDMVAVPFGPPLRMVAVATPDYLAAAGTPKGPQDLLAHRCVRYRFESGALVKWEMVQGPSSHSLDVTGPLTLGNTNLMLSAALQSIAIAWVPYLSAAPHLAEGRLIHVLPDWAPTYTSAALYYPKNRHPPLALRLFAEAVRHRSDRCTD